MIKGIGTDIVAHKRIKLKIAKKVLVGTEQDYFNSLKEDRAIEFLASRFALKEAIIKATNKKYFLNQIEICKTSDGQLRCRQDSNLHLSLSHEKDYSVAFVIWEEKK